MEPLLSEMYASKTIRVSDHCLAVSQAKVALCDKRILWVEFEEKKDEAIEAKGSVRIPLRILCGLF